MRIILASYLMLGLASSGHTSHEAAVPSKDVRYVPSLARTTTLSEALSLLPVSVDDFVRIDSTTLSTSLGIAGLVGRVTEVPPQQKQANQVGLRAQSVGPFTVFVPELNQEVSVPGNLVELIGLAPGATVEVDGRKWISADDGMWREVCGDGNSELPRFIYP